MNLLNHGIKQSHTLPGSYSGGGSAVYSLNYRVCGYTGAVIRVRRSSDNAESDFNPTEVTDGTLTTWTGANNGFITKWYNQGSTGSGDDFVQTSSTAQPQIVSGGSLVTAGGANCVDFDGANDYLDAGNTNLGISASDTALTIVCWVYVDVFANYPAIIGREQSGSPYGGYKLGLNTSGFDMACNISGSWKTWDNLGGTPSETTGQWYCVVGTYDGTDFTRYVNNTNNGSYTYSGSIQFPGTLNNMKMGAWPGAAFGNFKMGEACVFPSVFSSADVAHYYNNTKGDYGL